MANTITTIAVLFLFASLTVSQLNTPQDNVDRLINQQTMQDYKGRAYRELAYISDTIGPRLWGSQALEKTIDYLYVKARQAGFDNVRLEAVKNFTKWVRGDESLILHDPRVESMHLKLIGLGGTVSGYVNTTGFVVNSFEDLENNKDKVKGKIVIYNQQWTDYDSSVKYRSQGASMASKYGAVAALVRSVTPDSIESVHAGIQHYDPKYPAIPVAAISTEDAEMFQRMQKRGQTFKLELNLSNSVHENTFSNNLIFEIEGTEHPEQILLLGGHIDSWDTGSQTGSNDDGGGFISCFEALRLIKDAVVGKPKRTLRFIAWSGEEWGGQKNGAHAYLYAHRHELKNHIVAFEDDLGSSKFIGFGVNGTDAEFALVDKIFTTYIKNPLSADKIDRDGEAVDTGILLDIGIPTMVNRVKDTADHRFYFTYHHSAGDSMTMMNADDLDSNVLGIAIMFYLLADSDVSFNLPKINQTRLNEYVDNYIRAK